MDGKSKSVLCVLDIETETVMTVDNIPEDICPGQAIWCPDDTGIYIHFTVIHFSETLRIFVLYRKSFTVISG